jgi:archaemetzincin
MITLVPIGVVDKRYLETLGKSLTEVFGQKTRVGDGIKLTDEGWNQHRNQHLASVLLAGLPASGSDDRVLGVVDVDIFAPGLNFVFGEADITGRRAIISLQRLQQEFYGLTKNEDIFQERTLKEAVHELGHTYGLDHCLNPACVMHFSNSLHDTDLKGWNFCPACRARLNQ